MRSSRSVLPPASHLALAGRAAPFIPRKEAGRAERALPKRCPRKKPPSDMPCASLPARLLAAAPLRRRRSEPSSAASQPRVAAGSRRAGRERPPAALGPPPPRPAAAGTAPARPRGPLRGAGESGEAGSGSRRSQGGPYASRRGGQREATAGSSESRGWPWLSLCRNTRQLLLQGIGGEDHSPRHPRGGLLGIACVTLSRHSFLMSSRRGHAMPFP